MHVHTPHFHSHDYPQKSEQTTLNMPVYMDTCAYTTTHQNRRKREVQYSLANWFISISAVVIRYKDSLMNNFCSTFPKHVPVKYHHQLQLALDTDSLKTQTRCIQASQQTYFNMDRRTRTKTRPRQTLNMQSHQPVKTC